MHKESKSYCYFWLTLLNLISVNRYIKVITIGAPILLGHLSGFYRTLNTFPFDILQWRILYFILSIRIELIWLCLVLWANVFYFPSFSIYWWKYINKVTICHNITSKLCTRPNFSRRFTPFSAINVLFLSQQWYNTVGQERDCHAYLARYRSIETNFVKGT